MSRRLIVLLGAVIASLVFATPASASGATSSTQNFHGAFPPMQVTPLCGSAAPGGTLYATGNAVFHITVNAAGDVWVTNTQEAWFNLVPDTGTVTYTGHFAIWFGESLNKNNVVLHDTFNIHATGSDGSTISINIVDHMSMSASGQINVFMNCG
jgi:streptogramin lyase